MLCSTEKIGTGNFSFLEFSSYTGILFWYFLLFGVFLKICFRRISQWFAFLFFFEVLLLLLRIRQRNDNFRQWKQYFWWSGFKKYVWSFIYYQSWRTFAQSNYSPWNTYCACFCRRNCCGRSFSCLFWGGWRKSEVVEKTLLSILLSAWR